MKRVLSALLVLAAVSTAKAVDYAWPQTNVAIPDATAAGVSIDMTVNDNIPMSLEPTNCVELTITFAGIGHTWAGDLIITLSKVGDGSSPIINRIGRTSGSTGFGDSSDFVGPYTFTNKAPAGDIWAAAAVAGSTAPIPSGLYRASDSSASATSVPPVDICAPFLNSGSVGTWRLTISDNAGGDTGSLASARLTLKPEPSTLALLGLGVVALIRRRR